ncbi:unnamed protein product [Bursaphelenchus okinawaensis]|uniref:SANT domain-containing protein n=1 Tax=Bursaphelenchus okinawaensis TaxID=465554 RepID=A0A811KU33_9BILA|nr:unnamed protein product [Bursaphelenchus okinawaensis]CAG9113233.1 unnamed protein product [Bursaphelenchus okinawaensis]
MREGLRSRVKKRISHPLSFKMSTPEDSQQSTSDRDEVSMDVPSEMTMDVDMSMNENISESRANTPNGAMSTCSEVAEDQAEEASGSTPSSIRHLRSSGIAVEDKTEDVVKRRSVRKSFLQNEKSDKRPQDQPGIGDGFQAEIPDLKQSSADDEEKELVMWLPKNEFAWDLNVRKYIELARTCRNVNGDFALRHLFERGYDLAKALQDFEKLPLPQYVWKTVEIKDLVKKLSQGRKVQHVQKYFAERYGYSDARARVVEKRYELLHRLCYGESRWLCPAMMDRTEEEPVTSRRDCHNCNSSVKSKESLCNVCSFYKQLYGKSRPVSVKLQDDEYVSKKLDAPIDYNYQEEHFDCFQEQKLGNVRRRTEWNDTEKVKLVRGFRELGLNYADIAARLENRTEEEVEGFYIEFRGRYNLDELISNYDRELDASSNPRNRRTQEDRTPTPTEDSENDVDQDEVKISIRQPTTRSSITTRNKARTTVEGVA